MADISIIEFVVYAFFAYTGMLMLIVSTIKEVPSGKSHSIVRAVWLVPSILCAAILAGSGVFIELPATTNTIINLNTTDVFTEVITQRIELLNPIWVTFHFLIFAVMLVYVIMQALILLTKIGE